MSDVAIRFDGLILVGWLAVAATIYLLFAIWAAFVSSKAMGLKARLRLVARTAFVLSISNFAALAALLTYMTYADPQSGGPDWLDWLTVPALILFTLGCIALVRRRPATPT